MGSANTPSIATSFCHSRMFCNRQIIQMIVTKVLTVTCYCPSVFSTVNISVWERYAGQETFQIWQKVNLAEISFWFPDLELQSLNCKKLKLSPHSRLRCQNRHELQFRCSLAVQLFKYPGSLRSFCNKRWEVPSNWSICVIRCWGLYPIWISRYSRLQILSPTMWYNLT